MSHEDAETSRHDYTGPHSAKHPIPTIQGYKDEKEQQRSSLQAQSQGGETEGRGRGDAQTNKPGQAGGNAEGSHANGSPQDQEDTSQVSQASDPKQRRHDMKNRKADRAEREVTDPITHLPVTIQDFTDADIKELSDDGPEGEGDSDGEHAELKSRGLASKGKTPSGLERARIVQQSTHDGLETLFPPPSFQEVKVDLEATARRGMLVTSALLVMICVFTFGLCLSILGRSDMAWISGRSLILFIVAAVGTALCMAITFVAQEWVQKQLQAIWENEVWQAERSQGEDRLKAQPRDTPESLNKLIGSIWPLVNPDLFASLVDMLEDVMQASLPRFVKMVSVDDLGQGSQSFRILGIKYLPKGAAAKTVNSDGKVAKNDKPSQDVNTKKTTKPSNTAEDEQKDAKEDASKDTYQRGTSAEDDKNGGENQGTSVAPGMEPEEGEFINLEIAFAYRALNSKRRLRDRATNPHLYMAFYLPAGIKFPVWVELHGLIGTVRVRLQLTPDPPFVALCTMTFLGQPKVDLSCVPLVKHGLNIMDLPLLSNFVQSSVDAAMSEYVAPKSLTLDLKAMLAGDDFKRDTTARGVVVVKIKRAFGFKAADVSIPVLRKGSSDPYVSVGWAKFGKPLWSTRVLVDEMQPYFEEQTYILVGPEELDAEESLRVQLWDSDRTTADDDLGRIELPIKHIMKNEHSNGKMWDRTDSFRALQAGEGMPGHLEWSLGYFTKSRLMDYQVVKSTGDSKIKTVEQLKEQSFSQSKKKLREATHNESAEIEQLKTQDFHDVEVQMISDSAPSEDYPSGILSIQIHQIVGLELEVQRRDRQEDGGSPDAAEEESGDHLPDSYCTIMLDHTKIYKTRTKPKNSKPFFNACTEKFIRDWRTTSIYIAVWDARVHEAHALLGIVHLPIGTILRSRHASRFDDFYPITGGIGYGRIRISSVFRSVQLHLPPRSLGWDYGTLEISPHASCLAGLPKDLWDHKLRFRTSLARGKMHAATGGDDDSSSRWTMAHGQGYWATPRDRPIRLPVRSRYRSNLVIEFRKSGTKLFGDKVPAFAVLWLQQIPDEEEQELELTVWKGEDHALRRAEHNVLPESESGEKLGTLKLSVRFWRGLGRWHEKLAKKSEQVAGMMEVLEAADDEGLVECVVGDRKWLKRREEGGEAHDEGEVQDDSDSDVDSDADPGSGDDDHDERHGARGRRHRHEAEADDADDGDEDGKGGGILDGIKEYAHDKKGLHRKHRGIMQWKGARTLGWMKEKTGHVVDKIEGKFEHREREPGVDTEI